MIGTAQYAAVNWRIGAVIWRGARPAAAKALRYEARAARRSFRRRAGRTVARRRQDRHRQAQPASLTQRPRESMLTPADSHPANESAPTSATPNSRRRQAPATPASWQTTGDFFDCGRKIRQEGQMMGVFIYITGSSGY